MKRHLYTLLLLLPMIIIGQEGNFLKKAIYKQASLSTIENPTPHQVNQNITYFDGLGRPVQQIANAHSPLAKDIIIPIKYDVFGRQIKEYLPYTSSQNNMTRIDNSVVIAALTNQYQAFYDDINPYLEKEFEASPLNRVLKQATPGYDWRLGGGHEIKMDYQSNVADEVRVFFVYFIDDVYTPSLINNSFYAANELYKTVTKDENWTNGNNHTTEEFKNKEGHIILKRTYNDNIAHDTYFVYDDYGNLTYVLPPKVNTDDGVSQSELDDLCYQYKYDIRNRLIAKKLPGKGTSANWEEIVYNKLDQPILTRDPNLKVQNKWLFTKYDAFGRVAYTGLINSASTRISMQNAADGISLQYVTKSSTSTTIGGATIRYDNEAYPSVANTDEVLTINYYDDYDFDKDGGVSEPVGTNQQITPNTATKSLVTGSKIRVLGSPNWITNVIYYDQKGRPIYNYSKNDFLGSIQKVKTELDFVGKAMKTTTSHTRNNITTTVVDNFTYDHQGRLLTQIQKINNQAEELLVSNVYDELGQLKEKGVGGKTTQSRLQKVDYTYNIRGWLKGINDSNSSNNDITMESGDLFGFKVNYNNPSTGTALFNGNISQTYWKTTNSIDTSLRNYTYTYDALNRLTDAKYSLADRYNETLSYDKNGNITSLIRRGNTDVNSSTFGIIDNLTYSYGPSNLYNKLTKVVDSQSNITGLTDEFKDNGLNTDDYGYDVNGNMTSDNNKGISTITHNHLNLPTSVAMTGGSINYTYDATGVKQRKIAAGTITDYVGGFQYKDAVLQFFPTVEGYAEYNNGNGTFSYIYQYKDHLGNVRLSYKDVGTTTPSLQIVEESNYYPFGLKQKVAGEVINNSSYKYKYNGQELQDELGLNMYDYDARNYDPALGRWMNIDPLAEKGRRWSPYNYALNNPVYFLDPDGMLSQSFMDDLMKKSNAEGETKWTNNNGTFSSNNGETVSDAESIDPPASTISAQNLFGLATSLFGGTTSFLKVAIIGTFSSSHTPDWSEGIFRTERAFGTFSIEDVKVEAKTINATSKKGKDGSYTITFSNGKTYHGKGPIDRMFKSALLKMTLFNVTVKKFDWNPAESSRQAFKDEYRRMQTEATTVYPEGYVNPVNYNIIQSPGKNYILQDGL